MIILSFILGNSYHTYFQKCWFYDVKLYISSPKIRMIRIFGKFVWYAFSFSKFVSYAFSGKLLSIRIFIIKIRVDTHFHADTFSAPLGIQLIPSSRQVPALSRNPQGRQPSTQGYSWWHLRLSHTFVAFLLCTCADQMFWKSLHEGPIAHVLSIQAPRPDPLNPDPINVLLNVTL